MIHNPPPYGEKSKKKEVLTDIFEYCRKSDECIFDNNLVKKICKKHDFRNPFDVTKVNSVSILPESIKSAGYCIVHLGQGRHQFVKAIDDCFHTFERIESVEIPWKYRPSVLNETDTSESSILSIGFNHRIIHDFLYDDIVANPKMYGSRRTKINASYQLGGETIQTEKLQLEIDLITEYNGMVTVFEGKNGLPENFAVYQLFHPFLYFNQLREKKNLSIKNINCCYLLRSLYNDESVIRLYLYTFQDSNQIASIRLEKYAQYRLIKR